jgi:hypothetical protein
MNMAEMKGIHFTRSRKRSENSGHLLWQVQMELGPVLQKKLGKRDSGGTDNDF